MLIITEFLKRSKWMTVMAVVVVIGAACTASEDNEPAAEAPAQAIAAEPASLDSSVVGEAVTIADGQTHDADVAIEPDTGTIYAAWAVDSETSKPNKVTGNTPQDILVAWSEDDGATWSKPVRVNDTPGMASAGSNTQVRIAALGGNEVFVMWPLGTAEFEYHTMSDRSSDGGKTWGKDVSIAAGDGVENQEGYGALTHTDKDLYLAFLDYRPSVAPHSPTGVGFLHSKNGGKSFSESQRAVLHSCECCDNGIAVDSEGTLFIAFRDQDKAGKHTTIRDSAVVRSYDHGETWSDPVFMGREKWVFNGCPEGGPELFVGQDDVLHGVYWTGKDGVAGVYYTKSTDGGATFEDPMPVATADFYPPAYVDLAGGPDGSVWIVWDDHREQEKKVHLGRVVDGELSVLEDLSPGITPTINGNEEMTVMVWSDPSGLKFAQLEASV